MTTVRETRRLPALIVALLLTMFAAPALADCPGIPPPGPEADAPIRGAIFDAILLDEAVRYYTNRERCARNLIPVRRDTALIRAATIHSADMARLDFFAHESPVPGRTSLIDRFQAAGVRFEAGGENLFRTSLYDFGPGRFYILDLAACRFSFSPRGPDIPRHSYRSLARHLVEGWMQSPGHRENILARDWLRVGHGMAFRPDAENCGELFVTQEFAE